MAWTTKNIKFKFIYKTEIVNFIFIAIKRLITTKEIKNYNVNFGLKGKKKIILSFVVVGSLG